MNKLHLKLATTAVAGSLLFSNFIAAQGAPYSPKALPPLLPTRQVRITHGPELEQANVHDNSAIIRWTTNNPGGTDDHDGIVHYGTNPKELNQTATTPNRLNRSHPAMIFRGRLPDLQPKTTYYYFVESAQATGKNDGVKCPINSISSP